MLLGMKKKSKTADTFVENLRSLMRATGIRKPALAEKSGVSLRMIGYILSGDRTPTIEVADQIGKAFGLTGWQMIIPGLPADLSKNGHLEKLVINYTTLSKESRGFVDQVAEREANYLTKK